MKLLSKSVAAGSMVLVIFAMLLTSFQIAMYGDGGYGFFKKEYRKYQVADQLDMREEDLEKVTVYMMDYLIGKEEKLSIETTVDGKRQDFFNDQDRLHMEDVQRLFLGGLRLRNICLILALLGCLWIRFQEREWKRRIAVGYRNAAWLLGGAAIILAVWCTVDFSRVFVIFHKLFFRNDLWLFDPETDYMIQMLPEGFFFDMVKRIGGIFFLFFGGGYLAAWLYRRKEGKIWQRAQRGAAEKPQKVQGNK